MSLIYEDLAQAEVALSRAVAKLNRYEGGRMPSGKLWLGVIGERKRSVSLLLKLRALQDKVKRYET